MKVLLIGSVALLCATCKVGAGETAERRLEVLRVPTGEEGALERLQKYAADPSPMVRRAVARSLGKLGRPAVESLIGFLEKDEDALVRRTALRLAVEALPEEERSRVLEIGFEDKDDLIRLSVIEAASAISRRDARLSALLETARRDPSQRVSRRAADILWSYRERVASLRDRPEYQDIPLRVAGTIPLATEGWRFRPDTKVTGHLNGWMNPSFDDSEWGKVAIGRPWQDFGYRHEGYAWYRLRFRLPGRTPEAASNAGTDLVFEAVDESAWVWLNGVFLGGHDTGASGYDRPFAVDTRDLLRWGEMNQLVVRVLKPAGGHAGIWKPVYLEILKSDENVF